MKTYTEFYRVTVTPKENTQYNPLHDDINGKKCFCLNFDIGLRGFFCIDEYGDICTSPVVNIVEEDKTVNVETKNTFYIFELIEE